MQGGFLMKTIVLIACCSKKLFGKAKAENLYQSDLFKKSLAYAKSLQSDTIYILSAKHGLVELTDELECYNVTLNNYSASEKKKWAEKVISELKKKCDLQNDKFVFLAGNNYRKYLLKEIRNYEIPMKNLKIGEQLHWLAKKVVKLREKIYMTEHILVKLGKEYFEKNRTERKPYDFNVSEQANLLLNDLEKHPHAFVLAALMDRRLPAEKAWEIPYKIKKITGDFDMESLGKIFNGNKLHRYNDTMAEVFFRGVHRIIDVYNCDASRIWSDVPSSYEVVSRFRKFHGCGQKISTMAANILARDFFIPFSDYKAIDVSADVHVCRVMKRMGLITDENRDEAIEKAENMYPDFPGIIDYPLWNVGKTFCYANNQNCVDCIVCKECRKIV